MSLEPMWQYRGKYWLGETTDAEDKDQVRFLNVFFFFLRDQ